MRRTLQGVVTVVVILQLAITAHAGIIYESATLGPTGQNGGYTLSEQWLGSRFSVAETTQVTAIGGHLYESGGDGTVWGAIISMSSLLPSFAPSQIESEALGSAIFAPTNLSDEFIEPLSLILAPGDYALVFGDAGLFGTTGSGAMPANNPDTAEGIGSYFFKPLNSDTWTNSGFSQVRFIVEGQSATVPEPSTILLLGVGLIGLIGYGWRMRKVEANDS